MGGLVMLVFLRRRPSADAAVLKDTSYIQPPSALPGYIEPPKYPFFMNHEPLQSKTAPEYQPPPPWTPRLGGDAEFEEWPNDDDPLYDFADNTPLPDYEQPPEYATVHDYDLVDPEDLFLDVDGSVATSFFNVSGTEDELSLYSDATSLRDDYTLPSDLLDDYLEPPMMDFGPRSTTIPAYEDAPAFPFKQ